MKRKVVEVVEEEETEAEEEDVDSEMEEENTESVEKLIDSGIQKEEPTEAKEEDIDSLVNRTLEKFSSSKYHSKSKACSALHKSLMSSGKLGEKKLRNTEGAIQNQIWKKGNPIEEAQSASTLYDSKDQVAPPLKPTKVEKPETVGKGWFDFQPLVMDEKIKRDIKMIQMRNYLDPKRFYKNPDKLGKVLHVGTVIEGPSEYFSSRLSRKERKQTIVEEVIGDKPLKDYSKRKYMEIQYEKNNKKRMFRTKKKGSR